MFELLLKTFIEKPIKNLIESNSEIVQSIAWILKSFIENNKIFFIGDEDPAVIPDVVLSTFASEIR